MNPNYRYEDFAFRLDEDAKDEGRRHLMATSVEQFNQKLHQLRIRRERERATIDVLRELGKKLVQSENIRPLPLPHSERRRAADFPPPKPPRPSRRIFRLGSIHVVDISEPQNPWADWAVGSTAESSSNNASTTASFDGNETISMEGSAGWGVEAPNGGGSAQAWGYCGRYFSAPTVDSNGNPIDWATAWLQVQAAPSINWTADWSTNCLAYAAVTVQVQLMLQSWDADGNFVATAFSQPTVLYSKDQNTGGDDAWTTGATPQLLQWGEVTPGFSYGAFVAYYGYVQASYGEPTGSWSAGATSSFSLTGVLGAMQFDAVTVPGFPPLG